MKIRILALSLVLGTVGLAVDVQSGERFQVMDRDGRKSATIERNEFLGRFEVKDNRGRTTATIERNEFLGRFDIRDTKGKRIGTIEKGRFRD
jgi:uncharacterized protein YxjI